VDVAALRQATASGGMLSLRKSIKKRKLPMNPVRLKNPENEHWRDNCAMATAQTMLRIGFPEIAKC